MTPALPFTNDDIPQVSEKDIEHLIARTDLTLDNERRAILRNMSRIDVRACPGSGKTTLLVSKLGILASKWKWRSRGICVLSHTNVARTEIQSRFGQFPALQALNAYPHFVGTIQSFVDQFLGVHGALKAFGRRPVVIDNDRFRFEALKEFYDSSEYNVAQSALRVFFNNNPHRTAADCIGEIEYKDSSLGLTPIPSKTIAWGEHTESMQLLKKLKKTLSRRGYFRFQDMDALALHYLEHNPTVVVSLRRRFPVVLIDEMQDTPSRHAVILAKVFSGACVLQRIGDDRQAIYSDSATDDEVDESTFPAASALTMSKSFRLSPRVASLVQNLCCDPVEAIEGNHLRRDGRHTVFVFSRETALNVLPKFAELVAEDIGANVPAIAIRAVGSVQREKDDGKQFPATIRDYWPEFDPPKRSKVRPMQSLGVYIQNAAWQMRARRDVGEASRLIVDAISRLLRMQRQLEPELDIRPHMLINSLQRVSPGIAKQLKVGIAELCLKMSGSDSEVTIDVLKGIHAGLIELCPGKWDRRASEFWQLSGVPGAPCSTTGGVECGTNIFVHTSRLGNVEVMVDTIHSVKGETLRAILVLDTFQHTQHLASLLQHGYLIGQRPAKNPGKRLVGHLKRAFVAVTRPTDLLCLALFKEHVSHGSRDGLVALGWRVVDV